MEVRGKDVAIMNHHPVIQKLPIIRHVAVEEGVIEKVITVTMIKRQTIIRFVEETAAQL